MVIIKKGSIARQRKEERNQATSETAQHVKAVTDYNIMMGVLEDPAEDEEDE